MKNLKRALSFALASVMLIGMMVVGAGAAADFTDADKVNAYAVDAMNWAVANGLINGMGDGILAPQGNASRAQIATILMRYCQM